MNIWLFRLCSFSIVLISLLITAVIYYKYYNPIAFFIGAIAIAPALYSTVTGSMQLNSSNFQIGLLFFVGVLMSQSGIVQDPLYSFCTVMCAIVSLLIMSIGGDSRELLFMMVFSIFLNTLLMYLCNDYDKYAMFDGWGIGRIKNSSRFDYM